MSIASFSSELSVECMLFMFYRANIAIKFDRTNRNVDDLHYVIQGCYNSISRDYAEVRTSLAGLPFLKLLIPDLFKTVEGL